MKGILALLVNLLIILVFIHAIGSWIPQLRESRFYGLIDSLVSPILEPIRSVVKPINGIDFSPMVLILILYIIKRSLGV